MSDAIAQQSVSGPVVAAVLLAAVLHATWNAFAHAITDRLAGFSLIGIAATVGGAAIILVSPAPAAACVPFLVISVALHAVYNMLLLRCYQHGEFGQVYPLARGTSPWLVAIAAAAFAGESLTPVRLTGIMIISVGLASLVLPGLTPSRKEFGVIAAAILTGVAIAAYTIVDGLGVRRAGTAAGYAGWLFLGEGPVLPLLALLVRRGRLWFGSPGEVWAGLAGGLLSLVAYGLVLWAQVRGALAPIAALRETSVVIGAIIGAVAFHERFGRWRTAATVLVAGGVVLINL